MSSNPPQRIDFNSIKTTTLAYFVMYALFLVAIIWLLQDFFVNNFYEALRVQEASRTSRTVVTQFVENPRGFDAFATETARSNGTYIRVDTDGDSIVYSGSANIDTAALNEELTKASDRLDNTGLGSVSLKVTIGNTRYLIVASEATLWQTTSIIYVASPISPLASTLAIIRSLLIYVSAIVLVLALLLSVYLSSRISRPIENITSSAKELTRGNYNVKFEGGQFTETNALAEVLNTASYEMEKSDFYQREIIANVSHDLKTPLTMIRSYAEMINDISGDNPEKRREHLNVIITETDRLNKLVTDIMSASKLQSNAIELHKEVFDIVSMAKEVYESVEVLNGHDGYDIRFVPCKAAYVYGDRDKISQVLHNFVSNAVKYCGDDKFVNIELKRTGKKVTVHVIDHGMGIPKDEISHVWERYYRTSANHAREIEGSGIGLSIVKSILSLHNANYGVKSEEGQGSDFWFEMNLAKAPPANAKATNSRKKNTSSELNELEERI